MCKRDDYTTDSSRPEPSRIISRVDARRPEKIAAASGPACFNLCFLARSQTPQRISAVPVVMEASIAAAAIEPKVRADRRVRNVLPELRPNARINVVKLHRFPAAFEHGKDRIAHDTRFLLIAGIRGDSLTEFNLSGLSLVCSAISAFGTVARRRTLAASEEVGSTVAVRPGRRTTAHTDTAAGRPP